MYAETYNFELFPVGFVINPSRSYLGCSPYTRVFDSSLGEMGLLEVKCTTKESVSDVGYLRVVDEGLQLHRSHQYYEHCMGQMGLTGAMWCDLFVWCKNDSHCERIQYDSAVFARMLTKLDVFFVSHFLIALATKKT